jgi:hypothetical protein
VAANLHDATDVGASAQRRTKAASRLIAADDTEHLDAGAKCGGVVRCVPGAAGDGFGGVVLENQNGRFARDALDLAVDELVRD